jgi:hypothetical protein
MTKKECIKVLNKVLVCVQDMECFEDIAKELDIAEDELELALMSKIVNIKNDDLDEE